MSAPLPIVARYEGDGLFQALGRSKKEADAEYVVGEVYRFTRYEERSEASHRHFFAAVAEAWANLPEHDAWQFPNPESLRHRALIRTGYFTQRQYVAKSRAEAERVAVFFCKPDEIATITGNIVTFLEAESQSYASMGKKRFQESKAAVLSYCASLIGVEPETLSREAGKAA